MVNSGMKGLNKQSAENHISRNIQQSGRPIMTLTGVYSCNIPAYLHVSDLTLCYKPTLQQSSIYETGEHLYIIIVPHTQGLKGGHLFYSWQLHHIIYGTISLSNSSPALNTMTCRPTIPDLMAVRRRGICDFHKTIKIDPIKIDPSSLQVFCPVA